MLDKWYGNIGKKIKMLAKIAFVIGAVFFIIYGICIIFWGATFVKLNLLNSKVIGNNTIIWGVFTIALGPIVAFIATWPLYAFGQLVENTEYLRHGDTPPSCPTKQKNPLRYSIISDGIILNDRSTDHIVVPHFFGNRTVTKIATDGFFEGTNLISITLPSTLQKIGDGAFYGCTNLKEIRYEGTLDDWNHIQKGEDWDAYTGEYNIVFNASYDA